MAETGLEAIERKKKHPRNRWMPGERRERMMTMLRQSVDVAGKILPGFLLSFADVMGIPSGLHAAWMAAQATAGESLLWPAAGYLLSFVMRLLWGLPLRMEMLITLGVMLLSPLVLFRRGAWPMLCYTALALTPTAVVSIATGTAADAMLGVACMAFSGLSAPVMLRAMKAMQGDKPIEGMEARVAVGYTAGMLLCGGGRMLLFGLNIGALGASLITVCMALYLGAAAGTMTGMIGGLVLALQGLPISLSVALSLGGFLGGMVQGLGRRRLTCLCFGMGCVLTMLVSGAAAQGCMPSALAAMVGMMALGRRPAEAVQTFFRRFLPARPSAGDAYAASALANWEKTVDAMARAVPSPVEQEEARNAAWWRERLCAGCPDEESCTCMLSERACQQAEHVWTQRAAEDEVWHSALEELRGLGCGRLYHLRESMDRARGDYHVQARQLQKACYQRDMLVTHLSAMAGAARRFAQLSSGESWWDDLAAKHLRKRLSELAYPATLIYARRVQGHAQAAFELHRSMQEEEQAEELCRVASRVLDVPMRVQQAEDERVLLTEIPLWSVEAGMAAWGLGGARDNGDTYWLGDLSDGRYLVALSDGMGHGTQARQESGQTVTLLRLCLDAGYTRTQTLTAVNGMMLLASRGERFSTVDLMTIDLWTGQATLDKLGAAATRLMRGRIMTEVEGDALPLGILETVESRASLLRLKDGDELILMTDGIEDAFDSKGELDDVIREALSEETVQAAAELVMQRAKDASRTGRRDDMTVIILRVTKSAGIGR